MRKVSDLAPKNPLPPNSVIVIAVYTINRLLLRSTNNIHINVRYSYSAFGRPSNFPTDNYLNILRVYYIDR